MQHERFVSERRKKLHVFQSLIFPFWIIFFWRAGKPTRIYIEAGLGASDPIPLYDTGTKFAFTAALGVKRFIGERFSLGLESRGVSFTQKESLLSTQNVTAAINEFSLVLGYLF